MEAPRPGAPRRPGDAAAAAEERWRKLQDYLAAKGKLKQPSTKPYLKDKTSRQNLAPSKPEPLVSCHIPSMSRNAQIRKAGRAVPADQILPGKRSVSSALSELPAKKLSEKWSRAVSSDKHHLCRHRKSGSLAAPRAVNSVKNWSCLLKDCQGKAERDKKDGGAKIVPQLPKGARPGLGLKAKPQVFSKQASKASRQATGSRVPGKSPAWTRQAVETQVGGKAQEPPAGFKEPGSPQRQVRGTSQLGRSSAASTPVVQSRGQLPRAMKQSMMNPQAAGVLGQGGPLTGRENTAQSVCTALSALQREPSMQHTGAGRALQERRQPDTTVEMRRRDLKLTSGRTHSAACGDIGQDRSTAERNQRSQGIKPTPRTVASESRRTTSPRDTTNTAVGSLSHGRSAAKSRQPMLGAGQAPKTPPHSQDRRELLAQWLASRGKCYRRPPMTLRAQRRPQKGKEGLNLSFWSCMEEEKAKEREQLRLTNKIRSLLTECLKLAEEGLSSEDLLAMVSRIPEAEKFAQFWICKARLLARQGAFDVAGLYEAAVCAGAVPLQDLRDVLVGILKDASEAGQQAIPVATRPFSAEEQAETRPQCPAEGSTDQPISTIKLQVVPLFRVKEESSYGADMKLLTPVRRSLRIERAVARYPQMLQDHDPVVASLDDIMGNRSRFVFRNNDALPEEVETAEFVAASHSLGQNPASQP